MFLQNGKGGKTEGNPNADETKLRSDSFFAQLLQLRLGGKAEGNPKKTKLPYQGNIALQRFRFISNRGYIKVVNKHC